MPALEEFRHYFHSGNEVPVTQATIPAELAHRLIAEFDNLRHDNDRLINHATELATELELAKG